LINGIEGVGKSADTGRSRSKKAPRYLEAWGLTGDPVWNWRADMMRLPMPTRDCAPPEVILTS